MGEEGLLKEVNIEDSGKRVNGNSRMQVTFWGKLEKGKSLGMKS